MVKTQMFQTITDQPAVSGRHDRVSIERLGRRPNAVSLLGVDPDLGCGLGTNDLYRAQHRALVRVATLRSGSWDPEQTVPTCEAQRPGHEWIGLHVIDGLIIRRVTVGERASCEMLGTGDILRPWDSIDISAEAHMPNRIDWLVGRPTSLAMLDARFARQIAPFPSLGAQIIARLARRIADLTLTQAIGHSPSVDDRLPAFFWMLAQRFGTMTPDGARIDLPLTHELLGILVGARRPTVSIALKRLSSTGTLIRQRHDRWLLTNAAIERLVQRGPAPPALRSPTTEDISRAMGRPA